MTGAVSAGPTGSWDECLTALDPRPGEILLLTGSSTLPFETPPGDVDLVLLTPDTDRFAACARNRHGERLSEQIANGYAMTYLDIGGQEVDLEVWPVERVRAVTAAFERGLMSVDEVEGDFTRIGGLDVKVGTDLFHALRYGRCLSGDIAAAKLRSRIPWATYQAFRRDSNLINVRDAVKGIGASLRAGRGDEAYLKLCWAADSLVDGLVFHHGMSINRWKWRLRYLPLLPEWVGDWYRTVRFAPVLDPAAFDGHVGLLADAWRRHAGTEPLRPDPGETEYSSSTTERME